jgi:hypothetical protein
MRYSLIFILSMLSIFLLNAQEAKETVSILPVVMLSEKVTVKFGGFVRADYYIDSRKTVGIVEDLFDFFPSDHLYDDQGNDQNNIMRKYFTTQGTRFNALFSGPDVLKAKSSSYFEFDFTGGNTVNVRLRQAYLKLNWTKSELLIGKTWNPLTSAIMPSVIGFNTGIPFHPFGRGDQLRFIYKSGKFSVIAAAFFQNEHKSFSYINSLTSEVGQLTDNVISNPIPDLHLQFLYKSGTINTGIVSEFKKLLPSVVTKGTAGLFKTDETISSCTFGYFAEYIYKKLTIKGYTLYAQNLCELFQQGGYAVASIDSVTGARKFTPSNSFSSWINITCGEKVIVGLFGGYQKNFGFSDNIINGTGTFLGRWQNVDHIYRISPSVKYSSGRVVLAAEVDYNTVAYGDVDYRDKGKVKKTHEISGIRGLLAATFLF